MTEYPKYEFSISNAHVIYAQVFEKWCKENCKAEYLVEISPKKYYISDHSADLYHIITVTLIEEIDAAAFKLRWI